MARPGSPTTGRGAGSRRGNRDVASQQICSSYPCTSTLKEDQLGLLAEHNGRLQRSIPWKAVPRHPVAERQRPGT